jgi:HlyD family secretion protein
VSRAVDVGQTVAASLQAPTLFTIAQDLTKMQVETSVDEADIGRVKLEDRATFTVDAFPGQMFKGLVTQIRKAPVVNQNVVTYTVVISVDNPGERLLPGMTANVKLVYDHKPDVLKVPNAALRFRPPGEAAPAIGAGDAAALGAGRPSPEEMRERLVKTLALTEEQQQKLDPILRSVREQMAALGETPEHQRQRELRRSLGVMRFRVREILTPDQQLKFDATAGGRAQARAGTPGRVFVVGENGKPKAVSLTLGLSDGSSTEVVRGELEEGQEVIVGAAAGRPGTTSPQPNLRL